MHRLLIGKVLTGAAVCGLVSNAGAVAPSAAGVCTSFNPSATVVTCGHYFLVAGTGTFKLILFGPGVMTADARIVCEAGNASITKIQAPPGTYSTPYFRQGNCEAILIATGQATMSAS